MPTALSVFEGNILLWIQDNLRVEFLNPFIKFFTSLENHGELAILVAIILVCIPKTRKIGIVCLCSLAATFLIGNIIVKPLVDRPRPYDVIDWLYPVVPRLRDASFPSAHTSTMFSVAVVMLRELPKKYGVTALVLAILMGLSRLYVGVHYPSDVLCGCLLGVATALIACAVYHKFFEKKTKEISTEE